MLGLIRNMIKSTQQKFNKMNWKVINTEKENQIALKRLEEIFDSKKGSKNGDELEFLSLLIDN